MSTSLVETKTNTLRSLLAANKDQIEGALPKHLTADRLLNIAVMEARKNPALLECTQASFLGAIIQTAQLGLEPGGALGHSYLVPFKNKNTGTTDCQFIIGYRGMAELAYRSPRVSRVIARAVYDGDKFSYQYGTDEKIDHKPDPEAMGKEITHVYAIVFLKEGGAIFDVMERKEVDAARARSKSAEKGPWVTDYEAMAKKSVVRRMFKFTPVSIELQRAIGMDEEGDRGEQCNADVIETTGRPVENSRASKLDAALGSESETSFEAPKQEAPKAAAKPEVLPPKVTPKTDAKPPGRIELGKQLNANARALGVQLPEYVYTMFQKEPKDLTTAEMNEVAIQMGRDLEEGGK